MLPADTPLGMGPFKAIMEVDPALAKHTVYHPDDLSAIGTAKLPVMAWRNGACSADGNSFRLFLTEIASHGYLVIASGPIGPDRAQFPLTMAAKRGAAKAGAAAPAKPAVPPRITSTPPTTTAQLTEAIDWAIAENGHRGDGGSFGKVAIAWLDWQLKGSDEAAKMFQGDRCGLCTDPNWVVVGKKNIE